MERDDGPQANDNGNQGVLYKILTCFVMKQTTNYSLPHAVIASLSLLIYLQYRLAIDFHESFGFAFRGTPCPPNR